MNDDIYVEISTYRIHINDISTIANLRKEGKISYFLTGRDVINDDSNPNNDGINLFLADTIRFSKEDVIILKLHGIKFYD